MLDRDLNASTINLRFSAVRKLITEAKCAGVVSAEEAAQMTDIPNVRQQGTRLGNWLTKDQVKGLLAVPDRSTMKGKRDYVILSLLVGCALRQNELAQLNVDIIQLREGRWADQRTSPPSQRKDGLEASQARLTEQSIHPLSSVRCPELRRWYEAARWLPTSHCSCPST